MTAGGSVPHPRHLCPQSVSPRQSLKTISNRCQPALLRRFMWRLSNRRKKTQGVQDGGTLSLLSPYPRPGPQLP